MRELAASNGENIHVEETDIGRGLPRHFLHGPQGMGALNLVAVSSAPALIDGGSVIAFSGGLIAARPYVILQPNLWPGGRPTRLNLFSSR